MSWGKTILKVLLCAVMTTGSSVAIAKCFYDSANKYEYTWQWHEIRGAYGGFTDGNIDGLCPQESVSSIYYKKGAASYSLPPGATLGAYIGRTTQSVSGTYQKGCWVGWRNVRTTTYVDSYQICYQTIDFLGFSFDSSTREGHLQVKFDSGVTPSGLQFALLDSTNTVIDTLPVDVSSLGNNQYKYNFSARYYAPGAYKVRPYIINSVGDTASGEYSITLESISLSWHSYDNKTRIGSVTISDFWNDPKGSFFELRNPDGSVAYQVSGGTRSSNGSDFTYPFDLGNAPAGNYTLWAKVLDGDNHPVEIPLGAVTVEPVVFTNYGYTPDTQTATITIKDVGGNPQKVVAEIVDSSGSVARVIEGDQNSASGDMFSYSFQYGGVASGEYTIRIIATDTWGNEFTFLDTVHENGVPEVQLITAEVTSFVYDEISRDGAVSFRDEGKSPFSGTVNLVAADGSGDIWTVAAALIQNPNDETHFTYQFNLDSAPEGYFTLALDIVDTFTTTVTALYPQQILIDKTPPSITIEHGQDVRSLQDVDILIEDVYDSSPEIVLIQLTGGPDNANLILQGTVGADGRVVIDDPGLFPSLGEEDPPYTLTVSAIDDQGNESVKVTSFSYTTEIVTMLDGMDNKLWLPAVKYQFLRQNGRATISTEPIRDGNQQPIVGEYEVVAMLHASSPASIVLNGVEVQPGVRTVIGTNDFTRTGGRLSVLAHAAVEDVTGVASVMLTTTAPYAPAVRADLHLWKADVVLESSQWIFRQVIDKLDVIAMPGPNVPCRTSVDEAAARAADPIRDPVCLVEWTQTPDEAEISDAFKDGMRVAGLAGQAVLLGLQPIAYDLYLYSGDGQKILVGSGAKQIEVVGAQGAIELAIKRDSNQVYRTIEDVDVVFKQVKGPTCSITLDAAQAVNAAATARPGGRGQQLICLFEWLDMPGTLVQDKYGTMPRALGQLDTLGSHELGWRLSTFSKTGTRITLAEQTAQLEVVDPPAPTINLQPGMASLVGENIVVAPVDASSFGQVKIDAVNADLLIEIVQDGALASSETAIGGRFSDTQSVVRTLPIDKGAPLWHQSSISVKAAYARLPEINAQIDVQGYVAPMSSVRPAVVSATNTAVDTELLPVAVHIQDMYRFRDPYDLNTMGVWDVRVIRQDSANGDQPVSDWKRTEDGVAAFDLPIGEVESRTVRFYAEARLVSPVAGYERTEQSPRPLLFAVLRGGEIGAELVTRKLSGEAPFAVTFKAMLEEREMYNATGDIVWQVSEDDGATWDSFTPEDRYKFQYSQVFNKGTYLIRATTTNRYSGKQATTEQVQIIAYEKPTLEITGTNVAFVGSTQTLTAKPTVRVLNEETQKVEVHEIGLDATEIEWSTDGGKTYTQTGGEITLSSEEPARFSVWARVRSTQAPVEDLAAYSITKKFLEFKPIREPRVRVVGPSVIETGKTYTFTASTALPYAKMDGVVKGFFTMPDGTTVEAETAQYTPTKDDLSSGYLHTTYTAWVEGYEDQGAKGSHTLRSRVWQYVWPNFTVDYRADAPVAPATINLRVRTTNYGGKLDEPVYKWTIPSELSVVDASNPVTRRIEATEPGDYLVQVEVSDARGHKSVVDMPFQIGQAEPYALDLSYTGSNKAMREPVEILMRADITGGHPRDRIDSVQWLANGQPVEGSKTYGRATLMQGTHTIGMKVVSLMGETQQAEMQVVVAPNKVPECELSSRELINSVIVYADCTDEDGSVRLYEWNLGGEIRTNSSRSISITRKRGEDIAPLSLVAIDDSNGRSAPVHFVGAAPSEDDQP